MLLSIIIQRSSAGNGGMFYRFDQRKTATETGPVPILPCYRNR